MNQNQRARAGALMELVERELPAEFDVTGDHDAWPFLGYALLSRATGTLDSIFMLQPSERGADAMTLVRSLYEHVVHFAWLALDPSAERIGEWRKHDLKQRISADNDAAGVGVQLLDPSQRQGIEAQIADLPGSGRLVLADMAGEADDHWESRVEAIRGRQEQHSFRGLYAIAYRQQSGLAHPGDRSIHPVIEDVSATRKRVKLEDGFEGRGPYGMATIIYALALLISERALGWPSSAEVDAIFARYP